MFGGQDNKESVTDMRRHNADQKRLHPTRWLLAMSFLLMLPGIAAADMSGYGELTGSQDGIDTCQSFGADQSIPKASGQAQYSTSGNVNDNAGWQSSGSAYVQQPDLPDASIHLDEHVDAGPLSHGLGSDIGLDDDGLHADAGSCTSADTKEIREEAESKIDELKQQIDETRAEVEAFVEASVESAQQTSAEVSAQVQATVSATAQSAIEAVSSFFVEAYASIQAGIQANL